MSTTHLFYGRDAERAQLREILDTVAAQRTPAVVTVVADSGVGKTRLIQQFYLDLTLDMDWDPDNFWPDAFQTPDKQLHVNPEFPSSHTPNGPPRYLWLGMRWRNAAERNAANSTPLPTFKEFLTPFFHRIQAHNAAWKRILESVYEKGRELTRPQQLAKMLLGNLVPLADVALEILSSSYEAGIHKQTVNTLPDQLFSVFERMFRHNAAMPTILWLDDAHWIDAEAVFFFSNLLNAAKKNNWPIMIIATCWPTEWQSLDDDLFLKHRDARVIMLEQAPNADLAALARASFPGLSATDVTVIVGKADGNFATMNNNLDHLQTKSPYFINDDFARGFSDAGVERIQQWETEREKRLQQIFDTQRRDLRDFLARASQIGLEAQFLVRVLHRYTAMNPRAGNVEALIEESQHILKFTLPVSHGLYEFRDAGYMNVAHRFFVEWLSKAEAQHLHAALKAELVEYITAAYDTSGNLLSPSEHSQSVLGLPSSEQAVIFGLALKVIDAPESLVLRTLALFIVRAMRARAWAALREQRQRVAIAAWDAAAGTTIGWGVVRLVADAMRVIGLPEQAAHLYEMLIQQTNRTPSADRTPTTVRQHGVDYVNAGRIAIELAENTRALTYFQEAAAMFDALLVAEYTAADTRNLAVVLTDIGTLSLQTGDTANARRCFADSIAHCSRLVNTSGMQDDLVTLATSLALYGHVLSDSGDFGEALRCYLQALEILRAHAVETDAPEAHRAVGTTLNAIGLSLLKQDRYRDAAVYIRQALETNAPLAEAYQLPDDIREVSVTYNLLGRCLEQQQDASAAKISYEQSLSSARKLVAVRQTSRDLRDLSVSIGHLARMAHTQMDFSAALKLYAEQIALLQTLAVQVGGVSDSSALCETLSTVIPLYTVIGDLERADESEQLLIATHVRLHTAYQSPGHTIGYIEALLKACRGLVRRQAYSQAAIYAAQARAVADEFLRMQEPAQVRTLAAVYDVSGRIAEHLGSRADALAYAHRALATVQTSAAYDLQLSPENIHHLEQRVRDLASTITEQGENDAP